MFNIYITQRGLDSLAGGVLIGAVMYDNEFDIEYNQTLNIPVNYLKSDEVLTKFIGRYTANYVYVPFDHCDLDLLRMLRIQVENLVYSLTSKLNIRLTDCNFLLDSTLPKLTLGNIIKAKSVKKYPLIHTTRLLTESERRRYIHKVNLLYSKYRFNYNQGRITPNHLDSLIKFGVCPAHRPDCIKLTTDYLLKLYYKSSNTQHRLYGRFFYTELPVWWFKFYSNKLDSNVKKIIDLVPSHKKRSITKITDPYENLFQRAVRYTWNPNDLDWFLNNAPEDLKHEILL